MDFISTSVRLDEPLDTRRVDGHGSSERRCTHGIEVKHNKHLPDLTSVEGFSKNLLFNSQT